MKLYRGSSKLSKAIKPETLVPDDLEKLKSAGIDAKKAIWATSSKTHAIIFALFGKQTNFQIDTGINDDGEIEKIVIHLSKDYLHKFEIEEVNKKTYLYEFDSKGFVRVNPLEWVCLGEIRSFSYEAMTKKHAYEVLKANTVVVIKTS